MKKQALLFFALLFFASAYPQGVRVDIPPILNSRAVLVPNANISLCPGTATITNSTCSPASTQAFTDITLTTPCATGSPVVLPQTNVCSGVADALGNAGFWLSPGAYIYCINGPTITGKCYNLTVPTGAASGGSATITAYNVNNVFTVDSNKYTTIDAAIAAVPSFAIINCTESSTTATCTTSTNHTLLTGQVVWVQGVSVANYNGPWLISLVTPNTIQFSVCVFGSCTSGLGTGSGGTVALTATIVIPGSYIGAESAACTSVDGTIQSNTAPNITIIDQRGTGACGYNIAYNSFQQGAKPTQLSVWQRRSSPQSTSSALIATNQVFGNEPASGTMAGFTSEFDICGDVAHGCGTTTMSNIAHVAHEGYLAIRGVGNGIATEAEGFTGSTNIDRNYSTIPIGLAAGYRAHPCFLVGGAQATAVQNECYGFYADTPTNGVYNNYGYGGGPYLVQNGLSIDANDAGTSFTITTTSESGNTVTANVSGGPCTYVTGQPVSISGVTPAGYNTANAWVLTPGCNGGSSFQYVINTSGLGAGSGGTALGRFHHHIVTFQPSNLVVLQPLSNTQGYEFENLGGAGLFHVDNSAIISRETHVFSANVNLTNLFISSTVPTIAGAGCGGTVATIVAPNGTGSFEINTGTAPGSACTITMPAAATSWSCDASHVSAVSTTNFIIQQTGPISTTSVVLTLFSDVAAATSYQANDTLRVKCSAN